MTRPARRTGADAADAPAPGRRRVAPAGGADAGRSAFAAPVSGQPRRLRRGRGGRPADVGGQAAVRPGACAAGPTPADKDAPTMTPPDLATRPAEAEAP